MKQVRIHSPGGFRVDEIDRPAAGTDDALVRVAACGICGSDLGYVALGGVAGPVDTPMPLGHEISGTVEAVGEGVTGLVPGMRVVVNPMAAGNLIGNGGPEGGFAPWLLVRHAAREGVVLPIPEQLPFDIAALAEPLAVALHAVSRTEAGPESKVVVFGSGPIGLGAIAALERRGVADIVAVDFSQRRREAALRLGAHEVIDPAEQDTRTMLAERHGSSSLFGRPVVHTDAFVEATGAPSVIQDVVTMSRQGARLVVVAVHRRPVEVDFRFVLSKELVITGAIGYPNEFPEAIAMLVANGPRLAAMISHQFAFDDFGDAFATARDPADALKVMVTFQPIDGAEAGACASP